MKIGFDNQKYLTMQSEHIRERISKFGDKLYLEFGGKLFDDYHAARVLPGFAPDSKLQMLLQLADQAEMIISINADDIENNKMRHDLGLTYDLDVLRLVKAYRAEGLYVSSVVITQYRGQKSIESFKNKLEALDIKVYYHYPIEGYPHNVEHIVSDDGYGKNDYVETTRPLVVVTAPGPGSGKMATCLSQLYHENKRGIKAGYAKFETFPIWNLPLKHPVNMAGNCICDDEVCCEASRQEIIRRYYQSLNRMVKDEATKQEVYTLELLMKQAKVSVNDRRVVTVAKQVAEERKCAVIALELEDGSIVTGKTTDLLGPASAVLLNAIKALGNIADEMHLISPTYINPIQNLKTKFLGSSNPRLHMDEVLIALSMCAATDSLAKLALSQLPKLKGCQAHSTVMLTDGDFKIFKKLGVELTNEPIYETK